LIDNNIDTIHAAAFVDMMRNLVERKDFKAPPSPKSFRAADVVPTILHRLPGLHIKNDSDVALAALPDPWPIEFARQCRGLLTGEEDLGVGADRLKEHRTPPMLNPAGRNTQ
jgi:hypothetical protein